MMSSSSSMADESEALLDVSQLLGDVDEENWLFPTPGSFPFSARQFMQPERIQCGSESKRSLVAKLDAIARGVKTSSLMSPFASPAHSASSSRGHSSKLSPEVSSYLRHNLSSTPISSAKPTRNSSRFDPRTFTRVSNQKLSCGSSTSPSLNNANDNGNLHYSNLIDASFVDYSSPTGGAQPITFGLNSSASPIKQLNQTFNRSPIKQLNTTFDRRHSSTTTEKATNITFDKPHLNATFSRMVNESRPNIDKWLSDGNKTFDVSLNDTSAAANATLTRLKTSCDANSCSSSSRRYSRDSPHDVLLDEDRLSTNSDSSMSHRLNDVGDVQQLARLQEESLRQLVISSNNRSATMSPSSDQSPSTDGFSAGNNGQDCPSEEGSATGEQQKKRNSCQPYPQYSSQDSLPDSPYSSQSLDSQSTQAQDRLRKSMPNLNRIRGGGNVVVAVGKGHPRPPERTKGEPHSAYGLSRQHMSDPRLLSNSRVGGEPPNNYLAQHAGAPSRGAVFPAAELTTTTSHRARNPTQPRQVIPRFPSSGFARPAALFTQRPTRPSALPNASCSSRVARPAGSAIPRPGAASRLPAPTARSGSSRPSTSQPGSRASSVGPRRPSVPVNKYCS